MVDFSIIKNDNLRELLMKSESISLIPERNMSDFLQELSLLPEDRISEVIAELEKEKNERLSQVGDDALKKAQSASITAYDIKNEFGKKVLVRREQREQETSLSAAEEALNKL